MGLFTLSRERTSARTVANIIRDELEKVLLFYAPAEGFSKLGGQMFAQGVRCSCGQECLLPDFRFYYDGTRVAILPLLEASFMQELNEPDQRQRFVGAVRQRLGVEHVDLVLRGEQPPEYVVEYVR